MCARVKIIKVNSKSLEHEVVDFFLPLSNNQLKKAADLTAQEMKDNIVASIQRPGSTGNLADSIFAERVSELAYGVGNISYLDVNAKYWRAINYGSNHMVGKKLSPGTFSPGLAMPDAGSFRNGRFYENTSQGGSLYAPIVRRPIEAHNYIERTVAKLSVIAERARR